ncbi:hypothetical protein MMC21_008452 [Puttea exsequens]|nr:hypothetical protein [Puttea exsequens]
MPSNVGELDFFWCGQPNFDWFEIQYQGQQFTDPDSDRVMLDNVWHYNTTSETPPKFSCKTIDPEPDRAKAVKCSLRNQPSADDNTYRIQFDHQIFTTDPAGVSTKIWFTIVTESLKETIFSGPGKEAHGKFDLTFPVDNSPNVAKWFVPLKQSKGHIRITPMDKTNPNKAWYVIAHPDGTQWTVQNDGDGCEGLDAGGWAECEDPKNGCLEKKASCLFLDKGGYG